MKRIEIVYLLLLVSGLLAGCDSAQTSGQIEKSSQNTASTNVIQSTSKTPDILLFKGDNMTVIESGQADLKQLHFDSGGKKSCLAKADENIKRKLSEQGINGNAEYSEFKAVETNSFGADKFTVNFDKDMFSKINPDSLRKLDKYAGLTITRSLYYIKNNKTGYLLLIGQPSASSGLGLYYKAHLLLPLDSNGPVVEFESISDDPRRIKIADSGAIYYVQIDPPYYGAIKESTTKRLNLRVSLFAVDGTGNKSLKTKFDLECDNLDNIFHDL